MSLISVDIEADGNLIGTHSMISLGAVVVDLKGLKKRFYIEIKPIGDEWNPEALAVSGFSREDCMKFTDPKVAMLKFKNWLDEVCEGRKPVFIADNNGFDFAWVNWYFIKFLGENPFGWSSRRIGDLYCGMKKDGSAQWKFLRKTKHTHKAIDDAVGNAEAIVHMVQNMGLKLKNVR